QLPRRDGRPVQSRPAAAAITGAAPATSAAARGRRTAAIVARRLANREQPLIGPFDTVLEGLTMRAEAQSHIDQLNAATALLRRFLDWDRALRRLEELNAKVEDSALWDDPKAAQEVMRERRRLEEAIGATRTLERELADTSELMDLPKGGGAMAWGKGGVVAL